MVHTVSKLFLSVILIIETRPKRSLFVGKTLGENGFPFPPCRFSRCSRMYKKRERDAPPALSPCFFQKKHSLDVFGRHERKRTRTRRPCLGNVLRVMCLTSHVRTKK